MKKILLLAVIAILLTALTSCDPEPIPPGPPPVNYAISTNIIGKGLVNPDKLSGVSLGSDVTFKITPETGYSIYSIRINGTLVEGFQPSASESSYTFKDVKSNLYIEFTFVETRILLLSQLEPAWIWTKLDIYRASDNSFMHEVELTQAEKSRKMYHYYPSMEIKYINPDGSVYWQATWNLTSDVYKQGGQNLTVLDLTHNKFVHKAPPIWSNVNNYYIYAQYTYERK